MSCGCTSWIFSLRCRPVLSADSHAKGCGESAGHGGVRRRRSAGVIVAGAGAAHTRLCLMMTVSGMSSSVSSSTSDTSLSDRNVRALFVRCAWDSCTRRPCAVPDMVKKSKKEYSQFVVSSS